MSQEETPNQQRRQKPAQPTPATPVDLPRPAPLTLWTPEDDPSSRRSTELSNVASIRRAIGYIQVDGKLATQP